MKKIIVFGASGTIGKHVIHENLNNGMQVYAFCRNTAKLNDIQNPNLFLVKGDVYNQSQVSEAIQGMDIVVITLGSGKSRKGDVRSIGTKNIIQAMQKSKVRRLICQSTLGTGDSKGNLNFFWKNIMFGWFIKEVFLDHEIQEEYVKNSNLDWTIIRPGAFTDGDKTETYRHGFAGNDRSVKLKISRADVAHFIQKQITSNQYLCETPGLSY